MLRRIWGCEGVGCFAFYAAIAPQFISHVQDGDRCGFGLQGKVLRNASSLIESIGFLLLFFKWLRRLPKDRSGRLMESYSPSRRQTPAARHCRCPCRHLTPGSLHASWYRALRAPARSVTRRPIVASTTLRMMNVSTPDQISVAQTATTCASNCARPPILTPSGGVLRRGEGAVGEHAGEQGADDAADAVHAEGIEAVVVVEDVLEAGRATRSSRRRRRFRSPAPGRAARSPRRG